MNWKKAAIGTGIVVAAAAVYFFSRGASDRSGMQADTVRVARGAIQNAVTATGTVEPIVQVEVGTQVSGIIDRIYVDYNSQVKKGQLIAEMDKMTLQSELESTQAGLDGSKTEFEYQQKNFVRSKQLYEKKLISDTDYENALYNYEKAQSTYHRNLAEFAKVKRNLGYATITSPIDGIVISRAVEEGQTVAAGFSTPTLFTIANDLTQMEVIADVDEADIGQVVNGQRVSFTVDAYPDDVFEGNVTQVRLEATTESNVVTYQVVINAPNPELKLKPGLTANVTIYTLERDDVLTVPGKAFRFVPDAARLARLGLTVAGAESPVAGSKTVWRKEGMRVVPVSVTVGESNGIFVEVTGGLAEGDELLTGISERLPLPENAPAEQSPFMPQHPGGKKR